MGSTKHACVLGLALALAAGCGDDQRHSLAVETRVARPTVTAGEPIGARCAVLDARGEPALDAHGDPLTDSVELTITYLHEDAFATGTDGEVIAVRAGAATVRCAAPGLGLVDATPEAIEIVAGPPSRVVTQLARGTAAAGELVGATCFAFDAFNNPLTGFERSLALSPSAPRASCSPPRASPPRPPSCRARSACGSIRGRSATRRPAGSTASTTSSARS